MCPLEEQFFYMALKIHPRGVEPLTFGFVDRRSIQLSYGCLLAEILSRKPFVQTRKCELNHAFLLLYLAHLTIFQSTV